jgi:hypothetical protein
MTADQRTVGIPPVRERVRTQAPMWFAFFGGIVAWGVRLGVSYMLVPVACDMESAVLLHLVAVVTIAISLAAAFVGYRGWTRARDRRHDEGVRDTWEREEFLGLSGLFLSAFFAGVILLESSANFLIDPCLRAGMIGA